MAELTWSAEELAVELGVSEWLVRRNLDLIPHLRIGQRVVFPKFAVRKWLEEQPFGVLALEAPIRARGPVRPEGPSMRRGLVSPNDRHPRET